MSGTLDRTSRWLNVAIRRVERDPIGCMVRLWNNEHGAVGAMSYLLLLTFIVMPLWIIVIEWAFAILNWTFLGFESVMKYWEWALERLKRIRPS